MTERVLETLDRVHVNTRVREAGFESEYHHCHSFCQLLYVETGVCQFLIDGVIYDLHPGDFILVPAMALHNTRYEAGRCKRTMVFFREEDISEEVIATMPQGREFLRSVRIFQTPAGNRERIQSCLEQMLSEERINDERTPLMLKGQLAGLILFCGRVCILLNDPPEDIRSSDRQIQAAAQYINEHYTEPLTTADIARVVGFSPNYLSRKFHSSAGIGLHEYLVFVRLRHAALELATTHDSITAIALRCGFSDSNYFKDCFKSKYGVTPREYRKST